MAAYYNEFDPYAAAWLRNLIAAGHIAPGDVDDRSIADVVPADLAGYTQCHFFAGIGGWSYAARLAGWPDDRPLWTGSCPCQPWSVAGKGEGQSDPRHLWPEQFRLIRECNPDVWVGEQVAAAAGKDWLDGVLTDLEGIGYATWAAVIPACAVDAPHRRDRTWVVADADEKRRDGFDPLLRCDEARWPAPTVHEASRCGQGFMADASGGRRAGQTEGEGQQSRGAEAIRASEGTLEVAEYSRRERRQPSWVGPSPTGASGEASWILGGDGKARRFEPGIRLLAHGVPARVGKLRAYGNAIVPQVAAEVIGAYLDLERTA